MRLAYDELYLDHARRNMGDMYDYAVGTLGFDIREFHKYFLESYISQMMETGNCTYVAGKNGCELAKLVIKDITGVYPENEDCMYVDKSPQYWTGWALAYYQWKTNYSYSEIDKVIPITEVVGMYHIYHEMDIEMFCNEVDGRWSDLNSREKQLKRLRTYAKLSQRQLASASGVPLRQIQLFEQGQREIDRTSAETIQKLATVLGCKMEELI